MYVHTPTLVYLLHTRTWIFHMHECFQSYTWTEHALECIKIFSHHFKCWNFAKLMNAHNTKTTADINRHKKRNTACGLYTFSIICIWLGGTPDTVYRPLCTARQQNTVPVSASCRDEVNEPFAVPWLYRRFGIPYRLPYDLHWFWHTALSIPQKLETASCTVDDPVIIPYRTKWYRKQNRYRALITLKPPIYNLNRII